MTKPALLGLTLLLSALALAPACGGKVVFDVGTGGAGGTGTSVVGTSATSVVGTSVVGTSVVGTSVGTSSVDVGTSVVATSVGTGSSGCVSMCDAAHPQGVPVLEHRVVRACGCQMQGPCAPQCAGSPSCGPNGPPPQGMCGACIDGIQLVDPCYQQALNSPQCGNDPACAALAQCILGCNGG